MLNDKIASGTILYMSMSIGEQKDKFYLDYRSQYLIENVYSFCTERAGISKDVLSLPSQEFNHILTLVHKSIHGNSVVISIDKRKENRYMNEIFATKEELINSLLNI